MEMNIRKEKGYKTNEVRVGLSGKELSKKVA